MFQYLRFALRMLVRERTYSLAVLSVLALGIGANTAFFSLINSVLLRPLPFARADRLVLIWGNFLKFNIENSAAKAAEYVDYRDQTRSFEQVSAFSTAEFNFSGAHHPERLAGASVSANLFPMLGVKPAQGRLLSSDDGVPGRSAVVVVSHQFWQQQLGGRSDIVGQAVRLDERSLTVVGVMPEGFEFPHRSFNFAAPVAFWMPLVITSEQVARRERPSNLNVLALIKPEVTLDQAREEMSDLARTFEQRVDVYRGPQNSDMGWRITVVPLQEQIVGKSRRALFVLFAAVGLVLLIACVNAGNLVLMRIASRERELAIRSALGASRSRLIRQLLLESLLLSVLAGGVGVALASWSIKALVAFGPQNLPRLSEIDIDDRVLLFSLGVSLLSGVLFGIVPAVQASRTCLSGALKAGQAGTTIGRHRLRSVLIVSEIAISMVLLIGAGLMINSFVRLQRVNPVVRPKNVMSARINLPFTRYPDIPQIARFYGELIRNVESLPGVDSVSLSTIQPLNVVATDDPFCIEGRPLDFSHPLVAGWQLIAPGYFRTLGTSIVAGRDFNEGDSANAPGVAIINEAMARRYFPNENPIGRRLTLGLPGPNNPWLTIVGIAQNIPHRGIESTTAPDWYLPYAGQARRNAFLLVRLSGRDTGSSTFAELLQMQVQALDKEQPISEVRTISEVISSTTAPRRFSTVLLTLFSIVALTLASVGIYSVIGYSVAQRKREIGVRLALGATGSDIAKMIIREASILVVSGLVIGIAGGLAAGRVLSSLLYDVRVTDPATFVAVSALLLVVATIAAYLPARNAARTDPMVALRRE